MERRMIMKKTMRILFILALTVMITISMTSFCFADEWYYKTNDYVKITSPKPSTSLCIYKGYTLSGKTKKLEAKTVRVELKDRYSQYAPNPAFPPDGNDIWNQPIATLNKWKSGEEMAWETFYPFDKGTKKILYVAGGGTTYLPATGKYKVIVTMFPIIMPPDDSEDPIPDEPSPGYEKYKEQAWMLLTIKALRPPTNVKMRTGKKVVKVTYKKAAGATSYLVYRSTKKSSGFKKIGSTTKTYFYDKKAKKGKRYYYKIKSLRKTTYTRIAFDKEVKDTNRIYSKFTSPKRCGKVK